MVKSLNQSPLVGNSFMQISVGNNICPYLESEQDHFRNPLRECDIVEPFEVIINVIHAKEAIERFLNDSIMLVFMYVRRCFEILNRFRHEFCSKYLCT